MTTYLALLRGINVGTARRVSMKTLADTCTSLGYTNVRTYINSGNILFSASDTTSEKLAETIAHALHRACGFAVETLVLTHADAVRIAQALPKEWENNDDYRCDVAYLFPSADAKSLHATLPFNTAYVEVRHVRGAIFWRVSRAHYNQSYLNKLIGTTAYKQMTVRNATTARALARL